MIARCQRRHRWAVWTACWMIFLALWLPLQAAEDLPPSPKPRYIYDPAGWISRATFETLDARLQAYEQETSSQLVVAIFPRLPARAELFDFSQRLFEKWQPGLAGQDNGAIFFIFVADRKMRIHTGLGMEGALPDARGKQIIDDVVAPLLRQGSPDAAVTAGVDAMIAVTKGEFRGDGTTQLARNARKSDSWMPFMVFGLILSLSVIHRLTGGRGDVIFTETGRRRVSRSPWGGHPPGGWGGGGGFGGGGGGGFSGGGGRSGGGGASGSW
jgi:uncharacterized protein